MKFSVIITLLNSHPGQPRDSEVVRRHADSFAFPAFQRRLAAVFA
jgi:hypothetical protein